MKNIYMILISIIFAGCASNGVKSKDINERVKKYVLDVSSTSLPKKTASVKACKWRIKTAEKQEWRELLNTANSCVKARNRTAVKFVAKILSKRFKMSPWGSYYFGLVSEMEGKYELAEWHNDMAIKKSASRVGVFDYQKARLLYKMKKVNESVELFESALRKDETIKGAHLVLGDIFFGQRDYKRATKHFEKGYDEFTTNPQRYLAFSYSLVESKKVDRGIEVVSQGIRRNPQHLNLRLYLANIYEKVKNDIENALSEYVEVQEGLKRGRISGKPKIDIAAKIKELEKRIEKKNATKKKIQITQSDLSKSIGR